MQHDLFAWFKSGLSAGTVITVITLASGLIAAHGRDRERMDDLERRIVIFETSGVKRSEFEARDKAMVETLHSIDGRLEVIERALIEGRK